MINVLVVAIGGGIGAATRYLVTCWAAERFGSHFPYGTFFVNVAGCFVIGLFFELAIYKGVIKPECRLFVTTGFLGGLTTFSTFSYETVKLLQDEHISFALYNILGNCLLGLLATWAGISLAHYLMRS
ncbi:MAG: fluoride efflux transporter CrcB [Sporomusa sp.]